ncbi:DeoR family transcriptional regulator [Nocardia seriolae]|uniref:DeoR family transcriptional regulator n=1 Tax=Nocardia seriolae TaxID=37332 RepID=A0ABC9YZ11_9NOCA|nr:hypothetical protein NS14008_21195 [Nocardia seriolae]GEM26388.1 hypothetical protein NS2_46270 [Nocardia seriolae NBRC 15557]BEK89200.1 hypothetical protein NSERKGN1266_51510 [Nocardia seriolae]BEK96727.1 hypothetical protein NSER024013_46330 [Nocardia seriolae]GAM48812.1 DeoR family transcriptional regulator [Nocardia seriolae]
MGAVVETQPVVVANGRGEGGEGVGIHARAAGGHGDRGLLQRGHPMAQPRRQHLFDFGQRPQRTLLDAGDGATGRGPQPHGHGNGLLVVEQQRRQVRARAQPISGRTGDGVHGIAEGAQLFDIPAHGAHVHLELRGQFRAAPLARGLQQRQQAQQSGRGFQHFPILPHR